MLCLNTIHDPYDLIIGIGLVMENVILNCLQKLINIKNMNKTVVATTTVDLRTWFIRKKRLATRDAKRYL
jgi:hypothetical protein